MEWYHVLGIVLGNAAWVLPMFLWLRSESNADRREIYAILNEMKNETKDFHGRLCSIEERNKRKE